MIILKVVSLVLFIIFVAGSAAIVTALVGSRSNQIVLTGLISGRRLRGKNAFMAVRDDIVKYIGRRIYIQKAHEIGELAGSPFRKIVVTGRDVRFVVGNDGDWRHYLHGLAVGSGIDSSVTDVIVTYVVTQYDDIAANITSNFVAARNGKMVGAK